MASQEFPFGPCECTDGCTTCNVEPGPAAFQVTRHDGRVLKVCTRCDLTSDKKQRALFDRNTPVKVFADWDALGVFCMMGMVDGALESEKLEAATDRWMDGRKE